MRLGHNTNCPYSKEKMHLLWTTVTFAFWISLNIVQSYPPDACTRCQNRDTCKPPQCVCCSDKMPLTAKEIPQMVFFTFDDAITPQVAGFYRQLFDSSRRNPNGCPVSMTLFVSHSNTVYSLVREFYQKGMEIASHSVSHGHPKTSTFKDEANKQKQNLARMARIPHTRIKGWRSPFLEPLGDAQPNMLQELGYSYDATLTISKKTLNEKPPVPFTLDYGWPYDCKIKPCPRHSHRGFWEVPVISLMDYLLRFDCVYVDGCNNPPPDEEAAFRFLWDNFQSYYKSNKAPFGINMHASWFFYPDRLKAMDRFIRELVLLDDVYIVSVKQVIDWLRNPVKLDKANTFESWSCKNSNRSSSGTKSAFDLRHKQIEQRLKELRRERFEKDEIEFLQKHRTWNIQQAAKKAAQHSKYANSRQTPGLKMYARQSKLNALPSRTSSAMTWQQMLMTHARKQHSNARHKQGLGYTKARSPTMLRTQHINPLNNRMVRPVGKNSNSRQREIMLKEQKRIREQQRIAAQKRLKETKKHENKELGSTKSEKVNLTKMVKKGKVNLSSLKESARKSNDVNINIIAGHSNVQRRQKPVQGSQLSFQRKTGFIQPHKGSVNRNVSPSKLINKISQSPKPQFNSGPKQVQQNLIRSNLKKQSSALLSTTRKYKVPVRYVIDTPKQRFLNSIKVTNLNPRSRSSVFTKRQKIAGKPQPRRNNKVQQIVHKSPKIVISLMKPVLKDAIQRPVKRQRIRPKTLVLSKKSDGEKMSNKRNIQAQIPQVERKHISNKVIKKSKLRHVSTGKTVKIKKQNVRTWNLFNTGEIKLPWTKWILKDVTEQNAKVKKKITNGHRGFVRHKDFNGLNKTIENNNTPDSNTKNATQHYNKLSSSTHGNEHKKNDTIISSSRNTTDVRTVVKSDNKLTPNGHNLSKLVLNESECRQEVNCFSPNCFCLTNKNPFNMKTNEIPQMVYVTIEGAINFLSYSKMRSLFKSQRNNPNGCPIGSTFFVSEQGTSYSLAKYLKKYGTEIAMNGIRKRGYTSIESMKSDIGKQKTTVSKLNGGRSGMLTGWRSPDLKVLGDDQFELFENKSIYDSSIVLKRSMKAWPFTLDFGLKKHCKNAISCDFHQHPGLFEIPIIPLFGFNNSEPCNYADNCLNQPETTHDTYQYLMKNFEKYYLSNRAPFGLHLTQKWFHWSHGKNLAGLSKFFDRILEYNDVYITNIADMLAWMKKPTKISDITKSGLWNC